MTEFCYHFFKADVITFSKQGMNGEFKFYLTVATLSRCAKSLNLSYDVYGLIHDFKCVCLITHAVVCSNSTMHNNTLSMKTSVKGACELIQI